LFNNVLGGAAWHRCARFIVIEGRNHDVRNGRFAAGARRVAGGGRRAGGLCGRRAGRFLPQPLLQCKVFGPTLAQELLVLGQVILERVDAVFLHAQLSRDKV
jgi:hypothetical protein